MGLIAGGAAVAPGVLAACGGGGGGGGGDGREVSISNWTAYIDPALNRKFTRQTGIKVTYTEDINDNNEYFAKIRPNLSKNRSIGRDGFVLTDWMASRLINEVRWVQPLVESRIPNKANLRAALRSPGFDRERTYSLPWQSGVTGIAYNIEVTGREVRSIEDFLDVEGTKTVLTEMRDTIGLIMASLGIEPEEPTFAKAEPAFDFLERAVRDGKIDGFNGNEYVSDLGAGNLAAAFAWSGDVAQITRDNPDVRFAIPESGGMLWSDNFMIPKTSDRPGLASEWINFFYDPVNAARLTAEVQFISPVEGVPEELTKLGGEAAELVENPLVVPTEEFLARNHIFGPLAGREEERFDRRFSEILGTG
jgi:spermidine/putrescine transport system substrate-binding protein